MENSLTYTMNGDYQIPDLKLTEQPEKPLGKYGRMRKAYLKEHRPLIYNQLLLTEKLYPHLIEIDETAQSRLEQMMPQLAKDAGATEQLKASDPMRWVGLMNTCKAQAEEWNDVFKRFYRGKNVKGKEGAGLGLYLTSLILSKQGGYIMVNSDPGESCTFSVFLQNC